MDDITALAARNNAEWCDAEWIVRAPDGSEARPGGPRWNGVGDAHTLKIWETLGQGADAPTGSD